MSSIKHTATLLPSPATLSFKVLNMTPGPHVQRKRPTTKRRVIARRASSVDRTGKILAAAHSVLAQEGYAEFTMRNVASRAKLRLSTLQHYYPTKDALFQAVVDQAVEDYDQLYISRASMQSGSPRKRLRAMIDILVADLRNPDTAGFFYELWARAFRDPYAAKAMQRAYRHHRDQLRTFMRPLNPKLPERIIEQRVVMTAAMIEGLMLFIGAHKPRESVLRNIETEIRKCILRLASQR